MTIIYDGKNRTILYDTPEALKHIIAQVPNIAQWTIKLIGCTQRTLA